MVSKEALAALRQLDTEIGENWYHHQKEANTADDLLHFPIADGLFDAKFDGLVHAANLTAKSLAKYAQDHDASLDITEVTQWEGGNQAIRYARSQADFHWEIDTRLWKYLLLATSMRRAFRDAIQSADEITHEDETDLLRINNEFWDEVCVHYTYRTEIIERSRGFGEHPDEEAGSGRYGYDYEVTRNRDEWSEYRIDQLELDVDAELLKKDLQNNGESVRFDETNAPDPFPPIEKYPSTDLDRAAMEWIEKAKENEVSDEYLRVAIGNDEERRWIPTRYVGWKVSIADVTMPYVDAFANGEREECGEVRGFDSTDPAIRFGLCQAEYQRRLRGTPDQLVQYLETQQQGIISLIETNGMLGVSPGDVDSFFETAFDTIETFFEHSVEIDGDSLDTVEEERPVHPRFAPPDPEEPLPWRTDDPEMHKRFMQVRGFTI